jgi:hypothetical protein
MKHTKNHEAVLAFIKANENLTFDSIKAGNPKISDILMRGVIKDLQEEGIIAANDEDGGFVFTGGKPKNASTPVGKAVQSAGKKNDDEDLGPKTFTGRNNDKYIFNGEKGLGKSRVVLAVIRQYIKDNPKITLTKLQEAFDSKVIQPRFGVIEEISKAKTHIKNKRERHFFKEADILKVGDKRCVVTNQWSAEALKPILKIAKDLGYKIQVTK